VDGTVELSAFSIADEYADLAATGRDRLTELAPLARTADRCGLSTMWVAEHHFHPGGVCPAPPVLLAHLAGVTRRIRLGSLVSVLPFHAPLDLAEQYAMVDRLSGGRLNLGVGSGYIPMEFEGFGIDPATKRERFDAALATLRAALRGEAVRVGPGAPEVRLNVRPRQQPEPPIWVAVQRREALPFVARAGFSVAMIPYATVQSVAELGDQIREFRSHVPAGRPAKVSVALHVYAGERAKRARAALQRYLDSRLATQSAFYKVKVQNDPRAGRAETIEASDLALLGRPAEVARRLSAYAAAGVDEILGIFDFGGLTPSEVSRSVRALSAVWDHGAERAGTIENDRAPSAGKG
jgi:alkanesulfonate monooxygenase SsuD/methylene tetrahydromethanopterin reductase-like flavin-dependent oxidoreductase (luciferase family)